MINQYKNISQLNANDLVNLINLQIHVFYNDVTHLYKLFIDKFVANKNLHNLELTVQFDDKYLMNKYINEILKDNLTLQVKLHNSKKIDKYYSV